MELGTGRNWFGPLEVWAEERLARVLEANAQRWFDRWARSDAGRRLLAAAMADVAADAVAPSADGGSSLLEDVLVAVVARMGRDGPLRRRLLAALEASGQEGEARVGDRKVGGRCAPRRG